MSTLYRRPTGSKIEAFFTFGPPIKIRGGNAVAECFFIYNLGPNFLYSWRSSLGKL